MMLQGERDTVLEVNESIAPTRRLSARLLLAPGLHTAETHVAAKKVKLIIMSGKNSELRRRACGPVSVHNAPGRR